MEPVSTILTVAEAFKEAYLLARFVYKTARSTAQHHEEEKILVAEFKYELLQLRNFWTLFTRTDGNLIDDDDLNRVSHKSAGLKIGVKIADSSRHGSHKLASWSMN